MQLNSLRSAEQTADPAQTGNPTTTIVNNTVNGYTTDITEMVANAQPSIVRVRFWNGDTATDRTGFIYRAEQDNTYILTSASGMQADSAVEVTFDSQVTLSGQIAGLDSVTDLAVISVQPEFSTTKMPLTQSDLVKAGEYVVALGAAEGQEVNGPVSFGVVSLPNETLLSSGQSWTSSRLVTDLVLQEDFDGAPLLNLSGEVTGMICASYSQENCEALASNELSLAADELIENGTVSRGSLGILGTNLSDMEVYERSYHNLSLDLTEGIYVTRVAEGSAAEEAGVVAGDVLTGIDDTAIASTDALRTLLYDRNPGDEVTLHLVHEGSQTDLTAVLQ